MGVLIFKGMKVGVLEGDLSLSVDESGSIDTKLTISTAYNVLPLWLRIAYDNLVLSKEANKAIADSWSEDEENQKTLLINELMPSIQVFVSCGIALDALYGQMKPYAKITQNDIDVWKKKGTSRATQITQVIHRVYRLNNITSKGFKTNISSIMKFRDKSVHPSLEIQNFCTRPDIPVGIDWKFSAYRFSNSSICYSRTMEMILYLYEKKAENEKVNQLMENVIDALKELRLVTEKPNSEPKCT